MNSSAFVAHLVVFCAAPALSANTGGIHLSTASLHPGLLLKFLAPSISATV
jgi:hypothetical protein